jgi:hypothetical protein
MPQMDESVSPEALIPEVILKFSAKFWAAQGQHLNGCDELDGLLYFGHSYSSLKYETFGTVLKNPILRMS